MLNPDAKDACFSVCGHIDISMIPPQTAGSGARSDRFPPRERASSTAPP